MFAACIINGTFGKRMRHYTVGLTEMEIRDIFVYVGT